MESEPRPPASGLRRCGLSRVQGTPAGGGGGNPAGGDKAHSQPAASFHRPLPLPHRKLCHSRDTCPSRSDHFLGDFHPRLTRCRLACCLGNPVERGPPLQLSCSPYLCCCLGCSLSPPPHPRHFRSTHRAPTRGQRRGVKGSAAGVWPNPQERRHPPVFLAGIPRLEGAGVQLETGPVGKLGEEARREGTREGGREAGGRSYQAPWPRTRRPSFPVS